MAPIQYNFVDARSSVDEIPPARTSFNRGPSVHDKPFLEYVSASLRDKGRGGMPFESVKDRDAAGRRIERFISQAHNIPVKTYNRRMDDGKPWLFWELVDEEEAFSDEKMPRADDDEGVVGDSVEDW